MERWVLWRLVPSVGLVIIALASCTSFFMGGKYAYFYRISQPADANGMSWEDQKIATQFSVGDKEISFKLLNETKESIKVIWDEVTIVQYNKVLRVMHEGVPVENIYYSEGWETSDLFPI